MEERVHFDSFSALNSTICFTFTTVNDSITESDEQFTFSAVAENPLDEFEDDSFSINIYDDENHHENPHRKSPSGWWFGFFPTYLE